MCKGHRDIFRTNNVISLKACVCDNEYDGTNWNTAETVETVVWMGIAEIYSSVTWVWCAK